MLPCQQRGHATRGLAEHRGKGVLYGLVDLCNAKKAGKSLLGSCACLAGIQPQTITGQIQWYWHHLVFGPIVMLSLVVSKQEEHRVLQPLCRKQSDVAV